MSRDILILDLKDALRQVKWRDRPDAGELLDCLRRKFTKGYLLQHEKWIKRSADIDKHFPDFSFGHHFARQSSDATSSSSADIILAASYHSSSQKGEEDIDLTAVGGHLDGSTCEPSIPPSLPYKDVPDAFSQSYIFGMQERSAWRPTKVWSTIRKDYIPAIVAERLSAYSWISSTLVERLAETPDTPGDTAVTEVVDRKQFISRGILYLHFHPYNCPFLLLKPFHVSDHPSCADMYIGFDHLSDIERVRDSTASHLAAKEFYLASENAPRTRSAYSCPPAILVTPEANQSSSAAYRDGHTDPVSNGSPTVSDIDSTSNRPAVTLPVVPPPPSNSGRSTPHRRLATDTMLFQNASSAMSSTTIFSQPAARSSIASAPSISLPQGGRKDSNLDAPLATSSAEALLPAPNQASPQRSRNLGIRNALIFCVGCATIDLCSNLAYPCQPPVSGRSLLLLPWIYNELISRLPARQLLIFGQSIFVLGGLTWVTRSCFMDYHPRTLGN